MSSFIFKPDEFKKSSLSGSKDCVEVAMRPGAVGVRDSKDPTSPELAFTPAEWAAFIGGVKAGEFDLS